MSESIYFDYLQLSKTHIEKHGPKTIVLLQVGAFFEVYGFKSPITGEIQDDTRIVDFCQICNLNMSDKKIVYEGRSVFMAGFRDYSLDKYLQKITDQGHTAVVFVQEKKGSKVVRVFDGVYSSGTFISFETDHLPQPTNHIMCVWLELHQPITSNKNRISTRPTMVCGVAVANIFTGRSVLTEYVQPWTMDPTTFDELEKMVAIYQPNEILVISDRNNDEIDKVLQYSGVQTQMVHRISITTSKQAEKCTQQKYVQHILETFYEIDAYNTYEEFTRHPTATQAFCYLLNFIQERNPQLVRNIQVPDFQSTRSVLLANHTLKQLNILDTQDINGRFSSVSSFLNKCCSAMGRRRFHSQLVSPTTDIEWLNQEYEMTELLLNPDEYEKVDPVRKILGQIRDIEKQCRQLVLRKIYPSSLYHLYSAVQNTKQIHLAFSNTPRLGQYFGDNVQEKTNTITTFLESRLYLDHCKTTSSITSFEENPIRPKVCFILDKALEEYTENNQVLKTLHFALNQFIREKEGGNETEYVKIHETEKSGYKFQITKKRGLTLKRIIAQMSATAVSATIGGVDGTAWNQIQLHSASTSADEITFPRLTRVCNDLLYLKDILNKCIANAYLQVLQDLEKRHYDDLEMIADFVAKVDVLQTKAFIAKTYHYCRPRISNDAEKAFVSADELRHPLIEHIQTNEIYVANSLTLGRGDIQGVLLYGTNAVGKTSFIRALGVSIIMAQAGLFVPCSRFEYRPYTAIFSRILGNDNLFKGLSTFAVEMSELRVILKMADENSLILGDELCSGTETESALSIFTAGLMHLYKKESSFIFATHFHEMIRFAEIQDLSKMAMKHMAVHYDAEIDALVYDRKLMDGPGNRMYGLEVCKSLHLPQEFLDTAYEIRSTYFPGAKTELSHPVTRYNAKKIRGYCEKCKTELAEEIHHLEPQQKAVDGFIQNERGIFSKNHPANLASLCEKCHLSMHHSEIVIPKSTKDEPKKIVKQKTTRGYMSLKSENNI
jgi:DNA mismatch repair protein MutS